MHLEKELLTPPLNLEPLFRKKLFEFSDSDFSIVKLQPYFGDFSIDWKVPPQNFDASMNYISIGEIGIYITSAGENRINYIFNDLSQCDIYTFVIPLTSRIEVSIDGKIRKLGEMDILLHAAERKMEVMWDYNVKQMLIHIPKKLVHNVFLEAGKSIPISYKSNSIRYTSKNNMWAQLIYLYNQAMYVYDRSDSFPFSELWKNQVERSFSLFIIDNLFNHSIHPKEIRDKNRSRVNKQLEQLESYIIRNIEAPITLNDLLLQSHCSRSQLFSICRKRIGRTPMAWVRELKLNAARKYLLANPELSIVEVSYRYGFGHAGRFSSYYKQQFGELPNEGRM